jgi:hypothetical protein
MADIGVNWTAIAFQGLQEHPQSTDIRYNEAPMVSDEEVRWAIRYALNARVTNALLMQTRNFGSRRAKAAS